MPAKEHYVPNIREQVRSFFKAEIREYELLLQELERRCHIQEEAINLLTFVIAEKLGRDELLKHIQDAPNPYPEFDIKNGFFENARGWLSEQLQQKTQQEG